MPDHSSFSKNRHGRFREADLLRLVFDTVVQSCNDEGLIKGEGFATDASYIKADASRQRMVDGPVDWQPSDPTQSRAVREYLEALDTDPSATTNAEESVHHRSDGTVGGRQRPRSVLLQHQLPDRY